MAATPMVKLFVSSQHRRKTQPPVKFSISRDAWMPPKNSNNDNHDNPNSTMQTSVEKNDPLDPLDCPQTPLNPCFLSWHLQCQDRRWCQVWGVATNAGNSPGKWNPSSTLPRANCEIPSSHLRRCHYAFAWWTPHVSIESEKDFVYQQTKCRSRWKPPNLSALSMEITLWFYLTFTNLWYFLLSHLSLIGSDKYSSKISKVLLFLWFSLVSLIFFWTFLDIFQPLASAHGAHDGPCSVLGQHGVPGTFSQVLEVDIGVLLQFAKMRVVVVVIEGWGFASFSILETCENHGTSRKTIRKPWENPGVYLQE